MATKGKYGKIIFSDADIQFIKDNFSTMTNQQIADALGLKITKVRTKAYELGLKRMELQRWTKKQEKFLKENYKEIGDTELAEIFEVKWFKSKGWTKKHIEKKRRYLKLKRSHIEKKNIKERNRLMGRFSMCALKRWETTGQFPIGTKRVWKRKDNSLFVVIKTKSGFVHYNRYLWESEKGTVPKGMNVVIKKGANPIDYNIDDLEILTDEELIKRNWHERYPIELRRSIKKVNKLKRTLKQKQDEQINTE